MIYESTVDNFITLIRSASVLSQEQVEHFFRDAVDAVNLPFLISQMAMNRIIDINEATRTIRLHGKPRIKDSEISKRIQAFWVIASFGSENIKEVFSMAYPSQFMFITHDNEVYDLTVCWSKMDAQLAVRDRKISIPDGEMDCINHIAVVNSQEGGEALAAYGFDSFCVLDADKTPQYYQWD